jgi:arabinofuranan 3-O-arabinosyltransferase
MDPAAAAGVLRGALPEPPSRTYGPTRSLPPAPGDVGAPVTVPQVRRYDTPGTPGIVHLDSTTRPTIVDGSAPGLAELAAFGGLQPGNALFYAADLPANALRQDAARGANFVLTDTNRRAIYIPEFAQQNQGTVLSATASLPKEAALLDPFSNLGSSTQTVSVLHGAAGIGAPSIPGQYQFPEHAPIAAFDGDLSTSWVADRFLAVSGAAIAIVFNAPRDVPYVDVYPFSDRYGTVTEVGVNGIHHVVGAGWTRIPVNLHHVASVTVTIDHVTKTVHGAGSHGGFREIRIPGVHVTQPLRTPIDTARQLSTMQLNRDALTFEFTRNTGDDPFRRNLYTSTTLLDNPLERGDPERYLDRVVVAPATRAYTAQAWVYPSVTAPDSALDRLAAGATGPTGATFDSSSRFQNQPAYRASSAFTAAAGSPGWVGVWPQPSDPRPWISWRAARPLTLTRLSVSPSPLAVRRPTVVQLSWPGGRTPPLTVPADGSLTLPKPARARAFRLTILDARFPATASPRARQAAAVGIGSIAVPGLPGPAIPTSGPLHAPCGSALIDVAGRRLPLQPSGTVAQLNAGRPLPAKACAGPVTMAAGIREIRALPGLFSVDLLQLHSPAPTPVAVAGVPNGGRVLNPGTIGNSSVDGVRVELPRQAWLVLGESYDKGWQASCDGRSLGTPQVIDGYANGWLAPAGCTRVSFTFAPQSWALISYVISGLVCAALLVFLLVGVLRRRTPLAAPAPPPDMSATTWPGPASEPMSLGKAAAISVVLALALGFVFAGRVGAVAFPLLTLILWRAVPRATLTRIATVLLAVAVPVAYLITSPHNQGGYNFSYSSDLLWAHWIGVAAIVLLGLATFWEIAAARHQRRGGGTGGAGGSGLTGGGVDEREQDRPRGVEQEVVAR